MCVVLMPLLTQCCTSLLGSTLPFVQPEQTYVHAVVHTYIHAHGHNVRMNEHMETHMYINTLRAHTSEHIDAHTHTLRVYTARFPIATAWIGSLSVVEC